MGEREIRVLLSDWDAIPDAPADEHDCLIPQLYALLNSGASRTDVSSFLVSELDEHFGVTPDRWREMQLAERLVLWARAHPWK